MALFVFTLLRSGAQPCGGFGVRTCEGLETLQKISSAHMMTAVYCILSLCNPFFSPWDGLKITTLAAFIGILDLKTSVVVIRVSWRTLARLVDTG